MTIVTEMRYSRHESDSTENLNYLMPTEPARPTPADLARVLAVSDALMHRIMVTHAPEINAVELTMSQTKAIYLVVADGSLRMSELAARLHVSNSTATGLVDRLVELDMLERHDSPGDRRQVVVSATAHGTESLERFRELSSHRMREMLARLDVDELATVERGFQILTTAVEAAAVEAASRAGSTTDPSSPTTDATEGNRS
jgi:DNA-binding MarR family transcriptional regulator